MPNEQGVEQGVVNSYLGVVGGILGFGNEPSSDRDSSELEREE